MIKSLTLFFILFSLNLFSYSYDLVVCSMFKDEADYIREWVEFHIKQGVKHFYLYDNNSSDHPEVELRDYIETGIVEIKLWPYQATLENPFIPIQNAAFMDCIKQIKGVAKWCAFIDTDEFLFSTLSLTLPEFLLHYDNYECLCVDWQMYGTSLIWKAPKGEMIKHLLWRGDNDYRICSKCIVKPDKVLDCHFAHYFYVKNQKLCVDEHKRSVHISECMEKKSTVDYIRINHYFVRDRDFLTNVKVPRARPFYGPQAESYLYMDLDANKVYDPCILKKIH